MASDMVMRSVYLRPEDDTDLRRLAFDLNVTKSDLIRSAISVKLVEWLKSNDPDVILRDVEQALHSTPAQRAARAREERKEQALAEARQAAAGNSPVKVRPVASAARSGLNGQVPKVKKPAKGRTAVARARPSSRQTAKQPEMA